MAAGSQASGLRGLAGEDALPYSRPEAGATLGFKSVRGDAALLTAALIYNQEIQPTSLEFPQHDPFSAKAWAR